MDVSFIGNTSETSPDGLLRHYYKIESKYGGTLYGKSHDCNINVADFCFIYNAKIFIFCLNSGEKELGRALSEIGMSRIVESCGDMKYESIEMSSRYNKYEKAGVYSSSLLKIKGELNSIREGINNKLSTNKLDNDDTIMSCITEAISWIDEAINSDEYHVKLKATKDEISAG